MRHLNPLEEMKFRRNIKKTFGKRIGYLSNSFTKVFEKEIYIPGERDRVINTLIIFLAMRKINRVLVFPEDQWSYSGSSDNNSPLVLNTADITKFFKVTIEPDVSNYYVCGEELNFNWVFTICNEGDYHLAGDDKFIKSAAVIFSPFALTHR